MKRMIVLFVIGLAHLSLISCADSSLENMNQVEAGMNNPAELEEDFAEGFFTEEYDPSDEDFGETQELLPLDFETQGMLEPHDEVSAFFRFAQTGWNECVQDIEDTTGNAIGFNCARRRGISVILKRFLNDHFISCVDEGLAAQMGGGTTADLHIVHVGIMGDRRHSPRSLHAEQRAIDLKVLRVRRTDGVTQQFTYSKVGNRPFYQALRECWGQVAHVHNGCPYINGNPSRTASIGWENRNHLRHLHLSIPYCINGRYGPYYFRR